MGSRVTSPLARVAELADAQDSGSCARKGVGVQVPPRALWVGEVADPHLVKKLHRAGVLIVLRHTSAAQFI